MRGFARISPVYRHGVGEPDHEGMFGRVWRICRRAWVQHGTIVVKPEELPAELRAAMTAWANDAYGERALGRR